MRRALLPALVLITACGGHNGTRVKCKDDRPVCDVIDDVGEKRELARGLEITRVELNQAVPIVLMQDGITVEPDLPLVAERDALIRVYVTPDEKKWQEREVTARFFVWRDDDIIGAGQGTGRPTGPSDDADLDSTLNIELLANQIPLDATGWSVEIVEADKKTNGRGKSGKASFPEDEPAPLEPLTVNRLMRMVVVPVRIQGQMPTVGEAELESVRRQMRAHYPLPEIEVTAGDPLDYPYPINSNNDQGPLLDALGFHRETLGVAGDTYVYGVHPGFGGGLAWLNGLIGVGGNLADTMVHEMGHAQGLPHAPCGGAGGPDPEYPYEGASIGVFGWDIEEGRLHDPANTVDIMSYCDPTWISDHNYRKVWQHRLAIADIYNDRNRTLATRWRQVWILPGRAPTWGPVHPIVPEGERVPVEVLDADGHPYETLTGRWTLLDHLDGGVLLVPDDPELHGVRFRGDTVLAPR